MTRKQALESASQPRQLGEGAEPTSLLPPINGSEAAYHAFLPDAQKLDARDLITCRADLSIAYHNADAGVRAILPFQARIADELPQARISDVIRLPDLILGVVFASLQVDRHSGSDGTKAKLIAQAATLRSRLLKAAEALAASGFIPEREVEVIKKGHGHVDGARDCVALSNLFRKYETIVRGKSPVTPEDVASASNIGTMLLAMLKVAGTPVQARQPSEVVAAAEIRDRLWTLAVERHEHLWVIGSWLFGFAVEEHVPLLQSRIRVAPREVRRDPSDPIVSASEVITPESKSAPPPIATQPATQMIDKASAPAAAAPVSANASKVEPRAAATRKPKRAVARSSRIVIAKPKKVEKPRAKAKPAKPTKKAKPRKR